MLKPLPFPPFLLDYIVLEKIVKILILSVISDDLQNQSQARAYIITHLY